jgi:hypothetical protein
MFVKITVVTAATAAAVLTGGTVAHATTGTNWTAKTCSAFSTWERHQTMGNLDAMMSDSFNVPWKYLGSDVASLYTDVRGNSTKYIVNDEKYVAEDC